MADQLEMKAMRIPDKSVHSPAQSFPRDTVNRSENRGEHHRLCNKQNGRYDLAQDQSLVGQDLDVLLTIVVRFLACPLFSPTKLRNANRSRRVSA